MPTFQVADVVNLRSSPDIPMTIEIINGHVANCKWLNKTGDQKFGAFSFIVLEKFVPPSGIAENFTAADA